MDIDLDEIKEKYPDIDWRIDFADGEVRCLIGEKGGLYKAFAIPPHEYYKIGGKRWQSEAPRQIRRIIREGLKNAKSDNLGN